MNEREAFLRQARSDYKVFRLLESRDRRDVAECHALHYLQMSAEKIAKAALLATGASFDKFSHVAFSHLPQVMNRRDAASKLGWKNFKLYQRFLTRTSPIFRRIDELHPAVGPRQVGVNSPSGPNVEYPWPGRDDRGNVTWHVPSETQFRLLGLLRSSSDARHVLGFLSELMNRFEVIFPS